LLYIKLLNISQLARV